jgi:hypothetical protein
MKRKKMIIVLAALFVFSAFSVSVYATNYSDTIKKNTSEKVGTTQVFTFYDFGTWLPGDDAYIQAYAQGANSRSIAYIDYSYNGCTYNYFVGPSPAGQPANAAFCASGYDYLTGDAYASNESSTSTLTIID